jgi:hypothetical protein
MPWARVQERANLQDDDTLRLLHSLSCAKYKILNKEPATKSIAKTDKFRWGCFSLGGGGCRVVKHVHGGAAYIPAVPPQLSLTWIWQDAGCVMLSGQRPAILLPPASSPSPPCRFNNKFNDRMRRIKIPLPPVDEKKKVCRHEAGAGA